MEKAILLTRGDWCMVVSLFFEEKIMKKYLLKVFAIVVFVFVAHSSSFAQDKPTSTCVPFSMREVPDETCPEWKFVEEWKKDDIRTVRVYQTGSGLHLGVWYYWGQLGIKVWVCGDWKDQRKQYECMFSMFMEDNTWSRPMVGLFELNKKLTDYGEKEMPYIIFKVRTKDGLVVQRAFMRPK